MNNKNIKLPYGKSNFKDLIEEGYYYVDKTNYIEILENLDEKKIMFIRPRRFGKSLFVSILDYYYNLNNKDDFEKLFGNYYIGKNPTKHKNSYMILRFNFSAIETDNYDLLYSCFLKSVSTSIKFFLNEYKKFLNINQKAIDEVLSNKTASDIVKDMITTVKISKIDNNNNDTKIYVLIDEYDHFANELLTLNFTMFEKITRAEGFVRKFYEALKIGTESVIERIFITGVTPITLDSVTSGFNIAKNKSTSIQFNEMLGFKKDEVKNLIHLKIKNCPSLDEVEIYEEMEKYYDSYLFNEDATTKMFNSDMVLYYLSEIYDCKKPKELLDSNIMSDYTKIKNMFYIKDAESNLKVLKDLIETNKLIGGIVKYFNIAKKFDRNDLISLLFYTGIISITGSDLSDTIFKIPNYVIKELYYKYFVNILAEETNYELETNLIVNAIKEMAKNGNIKTFIKVVEEFLVKLSGRDFIKFDEKYIKIVMTSFLMLSKIYYVRSESEENQAYKDITCIGRDVYDVRHHWIIELKYIKKDHKSNEIEIKKSEAKKQIQKYSINENYKGKLHKVILIFVGPECKYIEIDEEIV